MKTLITGASGPYGSSVAQGLIDGGMPAANLILTTRSPEKLANFAALGADVRHADFDDRASLDTAFAGAERALFISTNRVGQRERQHGNAVAALAAAGVRHIVYTSFVGREGAQSLAMADHRMTEALIRETGIEFTFMRNSQYADAMRDAAAPGAARSGRWITAAADGRIALVTKADCIAACVAVMGGEGFENKVYHLTGPDLLSYRDLAGYTAMLSGRDISYEIVDEEGLYQFFDSLGIPRTAQDDLVVDGFGWCSEDMVSFDFTVAAGDFAILTDDVQTLTGRPPRDVKSFFAERADVLRGLAQEAMENT
ncbi:NAD(P)H-binding protein [Maritimibacter sp. DP07]|uniref:NAD(P)H-binding protein n=1 Tax=Maritimibacter harenae TaxID=2606218 RepID=A0A845LV54_9RHOB|nr:NmrA family NAD(P)-binding protein [Maritimibacter harenae]MZR11695.1 NAD(P)H-binding protein [Maritimibacter harenae]